MGPEKSYSLPVWTPSTHTVRFSRMAKAHTFSRRRGTGGRSGSRPSPPAWVHRELVCRISKRRTSPSSRYSVPASQWSAP